MDKEELIRRAKIVADVLKGTTAYEANYMMSRAYNVAHEEGVEHAPLQPLYQVASIVDSVNGKKGIIEIKEGKCSFTIEAAKGGEIDLGEVLKKE